MLRIMTSHLIFQTFGQPRVGNQEFASFFDGFINYTWRTTHYRYIPLADATVIHRLIHPQ